MLDALQARIEAQVPALAKRVEPVGNLADLMRRNDLPAALPAAHVIPLGLLGGRADAAAGMFQQMYAEAVGVLLYMRGVDGTAGRRQGDLRTLAMDVVGAVCGWAPDDTVGVFTLRRGALVDVRSGTMIYQLDFAIDDQLRISS